MFVDSHAHLDGKQFDSDRDEVIRRAQEAGIQAIVAIGNGDGPPVLDAGIQLAEKHPFMYATLGIHPHEAKLASDSAYTEMERLARHPKVIAWGEIGLDYYYDHSPRETQQQVFTRQMESGGSRETSHRDSLPPFRGDRRCVGGLPPAHSELLGSERNRWNSALLYRDLATCQASPRYGIH